jgi:uncharacterized protein YndB with AHSA1/START domain
MISVEDNVVIRRPLDEVFAFVADAENDPKWRDDHLETVRTSDGPIGPGTTYREVIKFMGRMEARAQIVEYEPRRRVALRLTSGPLRPTLTYSFEPADGGTRLTYRVDLRTSGLFRLMEPLMPGTIRKQWRGNFGNLKRILEG